ncbi:MAG: hypothetical protein ACE5HO_19385 [bacterium]
MEAAVALNIDIHGVIDGMHPVKLTDGFSSGVWERVFQMHSAAEDPAGKGVTRL